jgi:hypothetical protein
MAAIFPGMGIREKAKKKRAIRLIKSSINATLAQLVEQLIRNQL